VLVALWVFAPGPARAQLTPTPGTAVLRGNVIDDADDKPLAGATVSIEVLRLSVVTDSTGSFRLIAVPPGRHLVSVRRLGYGPLTTVVSFKARDTLEFDFALVRTPTPLPTAEVTAPAPVPPRLVEFEERRKLGGGRFVTPDVVEKMSQHRLADVVATMPGPRIVNGQGGATWVGSSRGSGSILLNASPISSVDRAKGANPRMCYAAVMLDGTFVYQGLPGEQLFDLSSLPTSTVAALEYYTEATVPMKFRSTGGITCGLLIIWTK
jgi:hypothetical protein